MLWTEVIRTDHAGLKFRALERRFARSDGREAILHVDADLAAVRGSQWLEDQASDFLAQIEKLERR